MRKIIVLVYSATLILGMIGSAGATPFTDNKYSDKRLSGTGGYAWEHDTPHNFGGPNDSGVVSATSSISGWYVPDDKISIFLNGKAYGSLNNGSRLTFGVNWTEFSIEDIFADWNAEASLKFSPANKKMNSLNLISSIFKLNFGSGSGSVVPEPAKLLLLGFVLIGIAFLGRKKFLPKSH